MKSKIKKIGLGIGAALILIGGGASFSEPGSESDPLVTFSYVEKKFEEIKSYVNEKVGEPVGTTNTDISWRVVEVSKGQALIGKEGTELLLRSGSGNTISNISKIIQDGNELEIDNGLVDVTGGKDLKMGEPVAKDHMLIVPRDDGRGVNCVSNSIFMVKGDYLIK